MRAYRGFFHGGRGPSFTVPFQFALVALAIAALTGCGDDDPQGSGGAAAAATGAGGSSSSTSSGAASTSSGAGGAGGGGSGGGGGAPACDALPAGPIEPTVALESVFDGSEDLAFDGKGHIAAKLGSTIVLADAQGQITPFAEDIGQAYGLRYRATGALIVALPEGRVLEVSPQGEATDYVINLAGPNGLYPDFEGNVWMTEFNGGKVSRINPDKSVDAIVMTTPQPNGVVFDATRKALFYTEYSEGRIRRVDMSPGGEMTPVEVAVIEYAALDGLVLDACGNLYAVDNGGNRLYRIKLDASGASAGAAELLASFPQNVANAQFGSGPGFDATALYVTGDPGTVYAVAVGVAGAPVPAPP